MNDEKLLPEVPPNSGAVSRRETHDDESALHSDWGSDESIHESFGDGRPSDDADELQGEQQAPDDQDPLLLTKSGARAPDLANKIES